MKGEVARVWKRRAEGKRMAEESRSRNIAKGPPKIIEQIAKELGGILARAATIEGRAAKDLCTRQEACAFKATGVLDGSGTVVTAEFDCAVRGQLCIVLCEMAASGTTSLMNRAAEDILKKAATFYEIPDCGATPRDS